MRSNGKKKRVNEFILYLFAFVCLLVVTFFTQPHIDEHIFSVSTDFSFKSIWDYCIGYGNGRLLGNLLCVFISHLYQFRFIFISFNVILLSVALNKLFFNGNRLSFIPILLLSLYPSEGIFRAVYRCLPSFINYVIPIILWIFALLIVAKLKKEDSRENKYIYLLKLVLLGLCVVASCLFSENTALIFVAAFALSTFNSFLFNKKIDVVDVISLSSGIIGSLILYFVPKVAGVSDKLDSYRGFTTSLDNIIYNLVLFSSRISSWFFILLLLSAVLCFVIIKTRHFTIINIFKMVVLIIYPFVSVLNETGVFDGVIIIAITLCYAIAVLSAVMDIKEKSTRIIALEMCFLICCSIAPMLIIELVIELGNRLNYLSCFLLILLSIYLFKKEMLSEIKLPEKDIIKKLFPVY